MKLANTRTKLESSRIETAWQKIFMIKMGVGGGKCSFQFSEDRWAPKSTFELIKFPIV